MDRVVLFARVPRLGAVKTRLVPPLTEEQALSLHEAMLEDQLAFVASLVRPGRTAELCLDARWPADRPRPEILSTLPTNLQGDGDLGRRLRRVLERGHAAGTPRIAIIAADAPTLPEALIDEAFTRLREGADAAVTPARDGGYVLIATARPLPALFRDFPWGTDRVLEVTRQRAKDAGIALAETAPWSDVDRIDDLARLLLETEAAPLRAPATARVGRALSLYLSGRPVL